MDGELMRRRVAVAPVARLATVTSASKPHVVPCCFGLDGDRLYTAVDDTKAKSTLALRRLDNVRARAAACLLVDHYADDWAELWWVRIDGRAFVAEPGSPDHARGLGSLSAKYPQYRMRPPPGAVIVIEADSWRGWP